MSYKTTGFSRTKFTTSKAKWSTTQKEGIMEVPVIEVRRDWPANAPEGWRVFNAPRPLYGHMTWDGEFVSGLFYAAVDPSEANTEAHVERNRALDARELVFLTQEELDERVDAHAARLAEEYGIDASEFDREDVLFSYQDTARHEGRDVRW